MARLPPKADLREQLPLPTTPVRLVFPHARIFGSLLPRLQTHASVVPGTAMSQPPSPRLGSGDLVSQPESVPQNPGCTSKNPIQTKPSCAGLSTVPQSRFLDRVLLLTCTLPALAIATPVALVNSLRFGSFRKAFYKQERVGLGGKTFVLWKFRTLCDEVDENGRKLTDQERANRFGRLLRNTHLDELPQIFNVLRGDMSFIGPRPEMVPIHRWACEQIPGFASRLVLRPGITGLAQVTQGYTSQGVNAYERKLEIDHDYIIGRSFLFDLRILGMTAIWMLHGKGWQWKEQNVAAKSAMLRALPPECHVDIAPEQNDRKAA